MMTRLLPVGIQDYPMLREANCLYVDKTQYFYRLITEGFYYFLSRPRRFGKSLTISTLEAIFQGKKELFTGTWIESSDYDWKVYPVIRIDMSQLVDKDPAIFTRNLIECLKKMALSHQLKLAADYAPAAALSELIEKLGERGKIVVLIDEYDKPILDRITDPKLRIQFRDILKDFYTILKALGGHIRFLILTGVTKFSKVSVFSGLNNLTDLTMDSNYAGMVGYTQEELESNFKPWIEALAQKLAKSIPETLEQIKYWYNGYRFSDSLVSVYNPFSTLKLFETQKFLTHWFETGTPSFLINLLATKDFDITALEGMEVSSESFSSYDVDKLDARALLYQTGYLTVKSYDPEFGAYQLGYPNYEVARSFEGKLLEFFSKTDRGTQDDIVWRLAKQLRAQDFEGFFETLKTFFAGIPYDLHGKGEKYYHLIIYLTLNLAGLALQAEVHTHRGRLDAVIVLKDFTAIFEFKLNQSADIALKQIADKGYADPYHREGKPVIAIGVNFDTTERNVTEWKLQTQ